MRASLSIALGLFASGFAAGCIIYDESLLSGGAGGTAGSGGSTGGSGGDGGGATGGGGSGATGGGGSGATGGGGSGGCTNPSQCPDDECTTAVCDMGVCGTTNVAMGMATQMQTAGDCKKNVCDGMGNAVSENDDMDEPNDGKECTTDSCSGGIGSSDPVAPGTPCAQGFCNAAGDCVECIDGGDCPLSGICTPMFQCAAATCNDGNQNGGETAIDCGGPCMGCMIGQPCMVNADCASLSCVGMSCAPSCMDGLQNQNESDVDCGGPCTPCANGLGCNDAADCASGYCSVAGTCQCNPVCECDLVISELRVRGLTGGNDEAIELFNPLDVPVVLDDKWLIEVRSSAAGSYGQRWIGSAVSPKSIPAKGHYLIAKLEFTGMPAPDDFYTTNSGIADAASIVLRHDGNVVDAVCFGVTPGEIAALLMPGYVCEGAPYDKPNANNVDTTLERKPGGAAGNNCTDTGNSATDFVESNPPNWQNSSSPPTP